MYKNELQSFQQKRSITKTKKGKVILKKKLLSIIYKTKKQHYKINGFCF